MNAFPINHLNGSDIVRLCKQYFKAYRALGQAVDAFCEIDFHQRDYYPKGNEYWQEALDTRIKMRNNLQELYEYLHSHVAFLGDRLPFEDLAEVLSVDESD